MPYLQRKYVDLIREVSSKWANWDPPIPVEIGAYGEIESRTGELRVQGNVYHPNFQKELDKLGSPFCMADYPPQDGPVEDDFVVASQGTTRVDCQLGPDIGVAGIANASIKGQWQFERGKRGALLIMHSPRQKFIPRGPLLERLYEVPVLRDKYLVTSVHVCPAFSMYLSNKSGKKVSLALLAQGPVAAVPGFTAGGHAGFGWWSDTEADLSRKACDSAGNYSYAPLFALKRRVRRRDRLMDRVFREDGEPAIPPSVDDLWADAPVPWDTLDDDGAEDPLDVLEQEDVDVDE